MKQIDISQMKYIKQDRTVTFTCIRCNKSKTAKKYAECIIDGETHQICNGCYGNLLSKVRETKCVTNNAPVEAVKASDIKVYISDLTNEEIEYICDHITPKEIRAYFQKNPKQFTKIRPGFRAGSLSDDDAVAIICKNLSNHFISSYLEKWLKRWLLEIQDFRRSVEEDGASPEKSLLGALPKSVFSDNIELYFKISDEEGTPEYIALVKTALALIKDSGLPESQEENTTVAEETHSEDALVMKEKNAELQAIVEQLRQEIAIEIASHGETREALANATVTKIAMQSDLDMVIAQNTALTDKTQLMQAELDRFYQLSRYADTESADTYSSEYKFTSICEVYIDNYSRQVWLSRLADIKDGKITRFTKDEDAPHYFENRDRLFWKNGPRDEGFVGIWQWNAAPNKSDPSTDYVTTAYANNAKIVEIIELEDCRTYEDIAQVLKSKTFVVAPGRKLFFACRDNDGQMIGLLCNERDFDVNNGNAKIKATVYTLPRFEISPADILTVAGRKMYGFTSLGVPQGIFQVRNPLAVVKEVIVARATSAALRQQGLSKKEAQHCQSFLKELPLQTIFQEIADAYSCTEEEAKGYVSAFVEQAESYLTASDIETGTLAAVLERNGDLVTRCKNLLTAAWEAENAEKFRQAQQKLDAIESAAAAQQAENTVLDNAFRALEGKMAEIQAAIDEKLALASDVESKVAERIDIARKNAAEFICDMAFCSPIHTVGESVPKTATRPEVVLTVRNLKGVKGEEIDDVDLFVDELADNLNAIGYEGVSATHMARTVAFCIGNRLPIICGANAVKIADCIAAMFGDNGAYTATLAMNQSDCGDLCESIRTASTDKTSVIVVNGAFDGLCLSAFNEIKLCAETWGGNAILVFPLGGVDTSMLPHYVWGQTMFIDGDIGLEHMETDDIVIHTSRVDFTMRSTPEETAAKRTLIKPLAGIISNTAMLNYAKYLAVTNSTLKDDDQVLLQVVLHALSSGKKEKLLEVLSSNGIDIERHKDITRYL